ncbi:MAG: DUF4362 domain-containing protein [bacterium]|nr:DUF4362 domain-containing protein [bacterium]
MKKKKIIVVIGVLLIIVLAGLITSYIDGGRVSNGHEPKCTIKITSKDGSKVTYWGLGYKVVRYVSVSPSEPYKNNRGVKMGSWFMKYELVSTINSVDDFYKTVLTQYNDIRDLSENYSTSDAKKDNCYVIGSSVNDKLFSGFTSKYNKKKDAFVRVVHSTTEGDVIITDVLYDSINDKVHIVTDSTRDKYASLEDRTIKYQSYEKISVWFHGDVRYWVAYNGTLPDSEVDETDDENFFIITSLD